MLLRRCRFLAVLFPALFWPVVQAAAQPAPAGPLFRVDPQVPASYQDLAIAAGPDGGFTVAWSEGWWREPAGGRAQLYVLRARRFDAAGKPKGPAFRLARTDDHRFGIDVAVNRDGKCLVVWSGDGTATAAIYGRLLDPSGRPLGNAFRLDAGREFPDRPRVVAHQGGYVVAWSDGTGVLHTRRVRNPGVPHGPEVRLPASPRYSTRSLSALAVSPRGDLAIAGAGRRGTGAEDLFLQRFDSAWRPRSGEVRVASPSGWRTLPEEVSLAFGADDALAVLWAAEPAASADSLILARIHAAAGQWAGPPVRIDKSHQGTVGSTALAADPGGGFLATWYQSKFIGGNARGRRLEPSGRLGPVFLLDPDDLYSLSPPSADQRYVRGGAAKVVALGKGRFATVWAGGHGILGQRFASDAPGRLQLRLRREVAAEGSGEVRLEVLRRNGCRGEVSISYSAAGLGAVPGEDFDDTPGKVTFADGDSLPKSIAVPLWDDALSEPDKSFRVVLHGPEGGATLGPVASTEVEIRDDDSPSPVLAGPVIPIASTPFPGLRGDVSNPDVAARPAGGFVVAWEQAFRTERPPPGYDYSVQFSLFDAEGDWVGGGEWGEFEPRVLPRPDGGFVLLGSFGRAHFGQMFDTHGEPIGEEFILDSFAPVGEDAIPLRAAPRPDGGFVAVGLRRSGTSFQLFAKRYDGNGHRLGKAVVVNQRPILDQDRDRQGFAVASDAAGGFVVVWQRPPQPGLPGGIFARRFAPSGVPRGGELAVEGPVGITDSPTVAVAPDGAFVVLWNSGCGGHGWTISARWFDRSGMLLGDEADVLAGGRGPLAAFGSGGKLLVISGVTGQLYAGPGLREGNRFTFWESSSPYGWPEAATGLAATGAGWTVAWVFVDIWEEEKGVLARTLVP
jgi:hypothetical protein